MMFSVITNIYNNKTKGPTLKQLFTATAVIRALRQLPVVSERRSVSTP
jgi:hypothetical protein